MLLLHLQLNRIFHPKVEIEDTYNSYFSADMVSVVVDTDYSRWAVLAQCVKNDYGPPSFLSTRIMGRSRALNSADMERARAAIRDSQVNGGYIYGVGQDDC